MIRYALVLAFSVLSVAVLCGCSQDKKVTKGEVENPKVETTQAKSLPGTKVVSTKPADKKTPPK